MLLLTLCITPLRRLFGWSWLVRLRRTCSAVHFHARLHFTIYIWLDRFFDWHGIVRMYIKHRSLLSAFPHSYCRWR